MKQHCANRVLTIFIICFLSIGQAQNKPVVAFIDFFNNTPIDVLTKKLPEYSETMTAMIEQIGKVEIRTAADIEFINQLRDELQLGVTSEDDPVVKLLNLPRDKFGTLLQQGADYLGFGVWMSNDNMIFKGASISLTMFLVDVETRETITVTQAIDNDALPIGRNPILDPPALDYMDELFAGMAEELSYSLTLPREEWDFRYEIKQLENDAKGRRNGKKMTMIGVGMLAFTQFIGALVDVTFLQVLAFDGYSFVIYLGLRDIYIGKDIGKRVDRLKKAYRLQYDTKI
ncbi:MAG: hypothetical protein ABIA75_13290 [Candidatus Neomarinimicrobiota bacterium]